MSITEQETHNFQQKVARYQQILENTKRYRETWHSSLKNELLGFLEQVTSIAKLSCVVEARADIENLEAVVVSLGSAASGLGEPVGDGLHRELIKKNGALVYQQLFNGKILVLINYPYIEKYGEPQPPKTVAIYRPEELKAPYLMQHLESFITELTNWEDYDDDLPDPNQRIGFKLNFEKPEDGIVAESK